ncbi:hypothetical protein COBT_002694 [Conglomerata obtusa]
MKLILYLKLTLVAVLSRLFYLLLAKKSSETFLPFDKTTLLLKKNYCNFILRWDAIYFREIAIFNYTKEHLTAFFPMYPKLIKIVADTIGKNVLFAGVLINNILFVINSILLYKITLNHYDEEIAEYSFMFYIIHPAAIIFSSLYSETLYMFLFLTGYYCLEKKKIFLASILFSFSAMTRSNGILNVLFLINLSNFVESIKSLNYCALIIIPFVLKQYYDYKKLGLTDITIPYSYIQKKYWEQGFLKFYTYKKNLPNFLVGIPFILFSLYCILSFLKSKLYAQGNFSMRYFLDRKNYNISILFALLTIQTFLCVFFVHMQMFARFVSYNPFFYWCLSFLFSDRNRGFILLVYGYFFYGIAYAILFGAYYPPA